MSGHSRASPAITLPVAIENPGGLGFDRVRVAKNITEQQVKSPEFMSIVRSVDFATLQRQTSQPFCVYLSFFYTKLKLRLHSTCAVVCRPLPLVASTGFHSTRCHWGFTRPTESASATWAALQQTPSFFRWPERKKDGCLVGEHEQQVAPLVKLDGHDTREEKFAASVRGSAVEAAAPNQ